MRTLVGAIYVIVWLATSGCGPRRSIAAKPRCPSGWRPAWTADSAVAVCLAPSFRVVTDSAGRTHFERGAPAHPGHAWFRIIADSALNSLLAWPPRLGGERSCATTDCYVADSVVGHDDSLRDAVVHVQTGLVTGGLEGRRREPTLSGGGRAIDQRRVLVWGAAENSSTLDTLRQMLRTTRLGL
jgi:hypothetical protein